MKGVPFKCEFIYRCSNKLMSWTGSNFSIYRINPLYVLSGSGLKIYTSDAHITISSTDRWISGFRNINKGHQPHDSRLQHIQRSMITLSRNSPGWIWAFRAITINLCSFGVNHRTVSIREKRNSLFTSQHTMIPYNLPMNSSPRMPLLNWTALLFLDTKPPLIQLIGFEQLPWNHWWFLLHFKFYAFSRHFDFPLMRPDVIELQQTKNREHTKT